MSRVNGEAVAQTYISLLKSGAILCSEGLDGKLDADILADNLAKTLEKSKYMVSDGAKNMFKACENLNSVRKQYNSTSSDEIMWIHCNAHIAPALTTATEQVLIKYENILEYRDLVCRNFNKGFLESHQVSSSRWFMR